MKTKILLLLLVLLLSGCATDPLKKSSSGEKAAVTPVMPDATRDININQSQSRTTEGNNSPR